ncbi:hypothetical protein KIPB_000274 [Kipferlia bialata]|uniref:Uncharacterized protein n=1 Tax=Kipferlia bialata TaxID=797122 RepID=A0A9K3CN61_9EUKA|nr:hypothetical protein KIPB_000274 [Kipferlia bialata]|eukprot:g274.t1
MVCLSFCSHILPSLSTSLWVSLAPLMRLTQCLNVYGQVSIATEWVPLGNTALICSAVITLEILVRADRAYGSSYAERYAVVYKHLQQALKASVLMSTVYEKQLYHPRVRLTTHYIHNQMLSLTQWKFHRFPLPHFTIDQGHESECFFDPQVHWCTIQYGFSRTTNSGMCSRTLIDGVQGTLNASEDLRAVLDYPPMKAPDDSELLQSYNAPENLGLALFLTLDSGLMLLHQKIKRWHYQRFIRPAMPCLCENIPTPSIGDYARLRAQHRHILPRLRILMEAPAFDMAILEAESPLTHMLLYTAHTLSVLPDVPEVSLCRILLAAEPLVMRSGSLYVADTALSLYLLNHVLQQLRGDDPGWFADSACLALLVAAFFTHTDRPAMSEECMAVTGCPRYMIHSGPNPCAKHSCSLFMLLEQTLPIKQYFPCFRELVRDIMIGAFHGFENGFSPGRLSCHSSLTDWAGAALVTLTDPGPTTPTGITLRLLLSSVLHLVRMGRYTADWATCHTLCLAYAREENFFSFLDREMELRSSPFVYTTLDDYMEHLSSETDHIYSMCSELCRFARKCVPLHCDALCRLAEGVTERAADNHQRWVTHFGAGCGLDEESSSGEYAPLESEDF